MQWASAKKKFDLDEKQTFLWICKNLKLLFLAVDRAANHKIDMLLSSILYELLNVQR